MRDSASKASAAQLKEFWKEKVLPAGDEGRSQERVWAARQIDFT